MRTVVAILIDIYSLFDILMLVQLPLFTTLFTLIVSENACWCCTIVHNLLYSRKQFIGCRTETEDIWWWRHQIETFTALLAICAGNSPVTGEFPHKGQWCGALMFYLIWAWINGCVNNVEAGDLRLHSAHYDVTVMMMNRDIHNHMGPLE